MAGMPDTGTIAIDVGGTFTTHHLRPTARYGRHLGREKRPRRPATCRAASITAIRKVLAQAGRTAPDILRVFHGTTTATNAILEGKTPPTALITTAAFRGRDQSS